MLRRILHRLALDPQIRCFESFREAVVDERQHGEYGRARPPLVSNQ